jgi:hypothetical protein
LAGATSTAAAGATATRHQASAMAAMRALRMASQVTPPAGRFLRTAA